MLGPACACKVKTRGKTLTSKSHPRSVFYKKAFPKEWRTSDNDTSQAEAKTFLPPTASIWRSNYRGAWWAQHFLLANHHVGSWGL